MSADAAAAAPAAALLPPAAVYKRRATPLQHTLIGGGAGVLEVCIMQPTVCVKNALQSGRPVPWTSPRAMYRGLAINATSFAPITAIQFGANRAYEQALCGLGVAKPGDSPAATLGAAAAAGATSTLVGNPAELVMIRQQQHGTSLAAAARDVWVRFGPAGFFRAQSMALGRESVYAACYLGLCPLLAARLEAGRAGGGGGASPPAPHGASLVLAGTAAGLVAAVGSQPFDTVKTRMQAYLGDPTRPGYASTARAAAAAAIADGGGKVSALWAGLLPRGFRIVGATIILQAVRSAALARIEGGE